MVGVKGVKKVLVTGAAGRLGSKVVAALLKKKKYAVRVLDIPGAFSSKRFSSSVEVFEADLGDFSSFQKLRRACRGVRAVLHIAGKIEYGADEHDMIRNNFFATSQLANAAQREGVKRLVFISSTSVYRGVKLAAGEVITEKTQPQPVNAYGRSKLAAENAVKASGLQYVILRPPIIYGPRFTEGFRQVVNAIRIGKMKIVGDGANCIAFIHVDDLVQAVLLALEAKAVGEDFIVTSGESFTQKQLFDAVAAELKVSPPSKRVSKTMAHLLARLNSWKHGLLGGKNRFPVEYLHTISEHRQYDVSKAKKILGYSPKVKFSEGLKEFVARL